MFFTNRKCFLLLLPVFCLLVLFSQTAQAQQEWRPVTPQELGQKVPVVEPDADAEAIFWEVRIDDSASSSDLIMKHYVRVKIFNERGREKYSKIDIPYTNKRVKIKDLMARVIKPDGSIVEVNKADVFEREIAKADKIKIKAKSFAVPGIEPGVIVEYRYQEVIRNSWANNMRMFFQHDIPIQNITYYFRPARDTKILSFNMGSNNFVKDKNGFHRMTMENVPAIQKEPQMPPTDEVRAWLLVYYWDITDTSRDFWAKAGGIIASAWEIKDTLKPGKDLKAAAAEITNGATSPDEQLARIYEFCQKRVKNITYDTTLTDEQKEQIKPSKSASDTYKKLQGTDDDINELFAALATALGFEARLAFSGDRSEKFFDPSQAHISFIHFSSVGVKVNGRWKYYDPGDPFVPNGMLAWNEENTSVLLLGYKDYITTEIPLSDTDKTVAKRTARLKLLEDGTLEGTIKIEHTGQAAYQVRADYYKKSANEREEMLKNEVKSRISAADISAVSIENLMEADKPLVFQYKIRVPNYAQKTGKRIFFQPGFFEYGVNPRFSTASRKYDIYFHYPWSEQDNIEIEYPKTFDLDNAESPGALGDPQRISLLDIGIKVDRQNAVLIYDRKFHFGGNGKILFQPASYQPLKNLFDAFYKADTYTISLKQK